MTRLELQNLLEEGGLSPKATEVVENVLELLEYDEDGESEIDNAIFEEIDNRLIYYSSAFDYLESQNITDFSEAINEYGAATVCQIAAYYLQAEILGY